MLSVWVNEQRMVLEGLIWTNSLWQGSIMVLRSNNTTEEALTNRSKRINLLLKDKLSTTGHWPTIRQLCYEYLPYTQTLHAYLLQVVIPRTRLLQNASLLTQVRSLSQFITRFFPFWSFFDFSFPTGCSTFHSFGQWASPAYKGPEDPFYPLSALLTALTDQSLAEICGLLGTVTISIPSDSSRSLISPCWSSD